MLHYRLGQPTEKLGYKVLEHSGIKRVDLILTAPFNAHEIGQLEDRQVVSECRRTEPSGSRELSCSPLTTTEHA